MDMRNNPKFEIKRIEYLDAAKGVGISLVVLGHLFGRERPLGRWIYSYHMPLFFVISGILLWYTYEKRPDMKDFAISRSKSLMYPYVVFGFLNCLFLWGVQGGETARNELLQLVLLNGYRTLWFLPALFFAELIAFLIIRLCIAAKQTEAGRNRSICLGAMCLCIAVLPVIFSRIDYRQYERERLFILLSILNTVSRILITSVFVMLGFLIGRVIQRNKIEAFRGEKSRRRNLWVLFGISLILNLMLFRFNFVDLHYSQLGNPFLYYGNAICGTTVVLFLSGAVLYRSKLLTFLGRNSLVIFLTHINFGIREFVRDRLLPMLMRNNTNQDLKDIVAFVFIMGISCGISWLVYRFVPVLVSCKNMKEVIGKSVKIHK